MTRFSETTGGAIYKPDRRQARSRVYFDVDDINKETGPRRRSSAARPASRCPCPSMGWFSINKDTEGNEFGLWQNDPNASMPTT